MSDDMVRFRLEWGRGADPNSWVRINSSTSGIRSGVLGTWDTLSVPNGDYMLRVIVEDEETGTHRYQIPVKVRSEEHTSELQSLMRISYAVFCLKKKKNK